MPVHLGTAELGRQPAASACALLPIVWVQTIFVVDDDPDQSELLAAALSANGRRIRAFSDPIRALAALQKEGADLLIADLSMPWLDGAQIVAAARTHQPDLAIILVSGYPRGAEVAANSDLTFFGKPIDLDRLRAVVSEMLGQRTETAGQEAT